EADYEPAGCPNCGHKPFRRRCHACGHQKKSAALANSAAGEMQEIRIGKKVIASSQRDLWRQLCEYTRTHGKPDTQAARAWHLYQDITGEKPPREWRFDQTEGAPITRGTLNKIKSLRIAYIKGRNK